mmetsp:Transcript_21223/g.68491  ORF Transcript_21223/g.68491 Transcript_21223/m.68491 type:complete len:207 (-) Transcript_21223:277-897(-)
MRALHPLTHRTQRHLSRWLVRVSKDAGGDTTERHRARAHLHRAVQRGRVAGAQLRRVLADGAHGVEDPLAGKPEPRSGDRVARLAAADPMAGACEVGACAAVQGAADAATGRQRLVGRVHHRVDPELGDVALPQDDLVVELFARGKEGCHWRRAHGQDPTHARTSPRTGYACEHTHHAFSHARGRHADAKHNGRGVQADAIRTNAL